MSLCEENYPKETAFIYLEDICNEFFEKFSAGDIERESAYSKFFTSTFNPVLKDKMIYYNRNLDANDNLRELKKGVLNYRDNVIKANDILIERGEKITLVVKKADSLKQESGSYYNSVRIKFLILIYVSIINIFIVKKSKKNCSV
jgi:membrane-associated HD superfamily phosphohydrolase